MKPTLLVPPAQAEALYDALQNAAPDTRRVSGQFSGQRWRDEDTDEPFSVNPVPAAALRAVVRRRTPSTAQAR